MAIVMQLAGAANGSPLPADGTYLRSFDFEAHGGVGDIITTSDTRKAMRFTDHAQALRFYKQSPSCRPLRADGLPNRPLTSTNWLLVTVEDA